MYKYVVYSSLYVVAISMLCFRITWLNDAHKNGKQTNCIDILRCLCKTQEYTWLSK